MIEGMDENKKSGWEKPFILKSFEGHRDEVRSVRFSPVSSELCSVGWDTNVLVWDLSTMEKKAELTGHKDVIYDVDYSPDGKIFATVSEDRSIRVWGFDEVEEKFVSNNIFKAHDRSIKCVGFRKKTGNTMVSGGTDKAIRIWDLEKLKCVSEKVFGIGSVISVDISSVDENLMVTGHSSHTTSHNGLNLWDLRTDEKLERIPTDHTHNVNPYYLSVNFNPVTGSTIASTGSMGVKIFDSRNLKLLERHNIHSKSNVRTVHFHPEGRYLISGSHDRSLKILDVEERKVMFTLCEHGHVVNSARFSSDGTYFACGGNSEKNEVLLWRSRFALSSVQSLPVRDEKERIVFLKKSFMDVSDSGRFDVRLIVSNNLRVLLIVSKVFLLF